MFEVFSHVGETGRVLHYVNVAILSIKTGNQHNFAFCVSTTNKSFSMTVNLVFSKFSNSFNSILKNQPKKNIQKRNVEKCCGCTQESQTSNLFERCEMLDLFRSDGLKSPPSHLSVHSDK